MLYWDGLDREGLGWYRLGMERRVAGAPLSTSPLRCCWFQRRAGIYWLRGPGWWSPRDRCEAPQELAISQRDSACPIDSNNVLVVILCFHNFARPLPASWMVSNLILNENFGSYRQRRQLLGMFGPCFMLDHMSLCHGFLSMFQ